MTDHQGSDDVARLMMLSTRLEDAVERAGRFTVTVYGRRRLPGSGIVWTQDGFIVTANHVVERNDDVSIGLSDGRRYPVTVRGRNLETDVALLQVNTEETGELTPAPRSTIEGRPGTLVLAIGRPSETGAMASFGIVHAAGTDVAGIRIPNNHRFLWSGVAMLPGFSGGPLVDMSGSMMGLNSSLLGGSGGLTIGNDVLGDTVISLAKHGRVRQAYIGIAAQSVELPRSVIDRHTLGQERGLLVVAVEPGAAAEQAGVLLGDVLLSVEGRPLASIDDLQAALSRERVGSPTVFQILRAGTLVETKVVVGERSS